MEQNGKRPNTEPVATNKRKKILNLSTIVNINEAYTQQKFKNTLAEAFTKNEGNFGVKFGNGCKVISEPFTCCILQNFIQTSEFVEELKKEIEETDVESKLSDLYQFKQSKDLAFTTSPYITLFKKLLSGECLEWMRSITNIDLEDKIDMSCSCYTFTDHLLCHDDELEGRRIAYIYYLVPQWEKEDGGTLDLFNTVNGEPSEIATSLIPEYNSLIFFEVSPVSFHQVSEVLAYKTRTSISGWFYGPPLKPSVHTIEKITFTPPRTVYVDVKEWINPTYLRAETQLQIRSSFEESSEIELMDFLQNEKYEELCNSLNSADLKWELKGPLSQRKYHEITNEDNCPLIIQQCRTLFSSEPFLLILSNLTGLRLHPVLEEGSTEMGEINSSIRKWGHGSYTLLHEQSFNDFATLNAALCFNCPDWEIDFGGYTSYVAKDEKEELLRVDPKPNSLALVYITEGTSNFIKYVNCRAREYSKPCFQDIFSIYREKE